MSKSVDVDLRIRGRNLAGKTIEELTQQVDRLTAKQKEQATASGLASASMRDLVSQSRELGAASRELARRQGLAQQFADQRKQIEATAARLGELTARYREMQASGRGSGSLIGFSDRDLANVAREITRTQAEMQKLVERNTRAGETLRKLGIDARTADTALTSVSSEVARASAAFDASNAAIDRHASALRTSAEAATEAARREKALQDQVARNRGAAEERGARSAELAALRADIEARSDVARATEVQAEAQRRLTAEQAEANARQAEATRRIREAVQAYDSVRERRAAAIAAFGTEAAATQRSNGVRERLTALLNTERGQRILAAEAARRETGSTNENTTSKRRNAAATRDAKNELALFSDVGRKSLGTYQRLRGQVLGLAAAYVGVFQAINQFQRAFRLTNQDQSLQLGLRTINNGDAAAAASDYQFLRKEADRLGLVFYDLAPQYANIAISSRALGMSTKQIRDLFSDTATAAAGLNLSVEDTDGLFRAVTQVMSKGKVQAEELRQQMGDRLPGAVVKFAAASGIALKDLDDMLQRGEVGVGLLIEGIKDYAKMYESEIDTISNRMQGMLNKATNAYNDFVRSLLNDSNQQKIGQALGRITEFFNSYEGERFAERLATAIGKAVDAVIWMADNMDILINVVKVFIGLQFAKFLNDVVIGVVGVAKSARTMASAVIAARVAMVGASTAAGALTLRTRALALAFGPVGIAMTTIAGLALLVERNYDKASESTDRFIHKIGQLGEARGADAEAAAEAAAREAEAKRTEAAQLERQLRMAESRRGLFGVQEGLQVVQDRLYGSANSATALRERLAQVNQEGELAATTAKRLYAEFRRFQETPVDEGTVQPIRLTPDDDGKGAAKAMREANARANAARAVQRQILDLDQQIFDARIDGDVRTSRQIQDNYSLTIQKIEAEIEDAYLALERLEQNVRTANKGTVPEEERAALALAAERLESLRLIRNTRAMEVSELQDVQIAERRINELISARDAAIERQNTLREVGAVNEQDAYGEVIRLQDTYNAQINELIENLLPQLEAIDPDSNLYHRLGVPELIAGLRQAQAEMIRLTDSQRVALSVGREFASGASQWFVGFGQGIADALRGFQGWTDAFKNALDAFRNFAADFLQQIAQMILQAVIFQAIRNSIMGTTGGYGRAVVNAFTQHTGGLAGSQGRSRRAVDPSVFVGAQVLHGGGMPGLRSDEYATILKKNEEVLTESNPRHVFNAGEGGAAGANITNVTVLDPADVISQALRSGSRVVINDLTAAMRANRNEIKTALGI